jgi:hypothetical protein
LLSVANNFDFQDRKEHLSQYLMTSYFNIKSYPNLHCNLKIKSDCFGEESSRINSTLSQTTSERLILELEQFYFINPNDTIVGDQIKQHNNNCCFDIITTQN